MTNKGRGHTVKHAHVLILAYSHLFTTIKGGE